jgi:phenylpyruvate tautomerase PptA (4-oxalocrotonate tautomerase family)
VQRPVKLPKKTGLSASKPSSASSRARNSDEQKSRMIAETTAVLRRELGDPILPLYVIFDEVPATAWGYNGRTVAEIAAAKAA